MEPTAEILKNIQLLKVQLETLKDRSWQSSALHLGSTLRESNVQSLLQNLDTILSLNSMKEEENYQVKESLSLKENFESDSENEMGPQSQDLEKDIKPSDDLKVKKSLEKKASARKNRIVVGRPYTREYTSEPTIGPVEAKKNDKELGKEVDDVKKPGVKKKSRKILDSGTESDGIISMNRRKSIVETWNESRNGVGTNGSVPRKLPKFRGHLGSFGIVDAKEFLEVFVRCCRANGVSLGHYPALLATCLDNVDAKWLESWLDSNLDSSTTWNDIEKAFIGHFQDPNAAALWMFQLKSLKMGKDGVQKYSDQISFYN